MNHSQAGETLHAEPVNTDGKVPPADGETQLPPPGLADPGKTSIPYPLGSEQIPQKSMDSLSRGDCLSLSWASHDHANDPGAGRSMHPHGWAQPVYTEETDRRRVPRLSAVEYHDAVPMKELLAGVLPEELRDPFAVLGRKMFDQVHMARLCEEWLTNSDHLELPRRVRETLECLRWHTARLYARDILVSNAVASTQQRLLLLERHYSESLELNRKLSARLDEWQRRSERVMRNQETSIELNKANYERRQEKKRQYQEWDTERKRSHPRGGAVLEPRPVWESSSTQEGWKDLSDPPREDFVRDPPEVWRHKDPTPLPQAREVTKTVIYRSNDPPAATEQCQCVGCGRKGRKEGTGCWFDGGCTRAPIELTKTADLIWSRSDDGVEFFVNHCKGCWMVQWARWLYRNNYEQYVRLHGDRSDYPIEESMAAQQYGIAKGACRYEYPLPANRAGY